MSDDRPPPEPILQSLRLIGAILSLAALPLAAQLPRTTLVRTIGCDECGGATQFESILDVAVDASGGFLVINNSEPVLRRFNARGESVWATGKSGRGPGEYVQPMWAVLSPDGVQVIDMTARRVSRLSASGEFESSSALRGFPTAAIAQGQSGAFLLLIDDFRGGHSLQRWTRGDSGRAYLAIPPASTPPAPGQITFTALAVTSDGAFAFVRDINQYRIEVVGRDGVAARTLTRDIERPRRSAEERAALDRALARGAAHARASAEPRSAGGSRGGAPGVAGDMEFKPHIAINGLRYDSRSRLWVRTMRGDHTTTVFDIFAGSGAFLGELRLPGSVNVFSLAGDWLAVATENEDGYPIVRVYRVE